MARDALERARERLPGDVSASFLVDHARSAPAGLLEVAERRRAAMIVVGTSGHPAIGSVTARLLHGSPVPVALAPHAFRARPGARVERVTAAFGGSEGLLDAADDLAARLGAPLRIASFAVPATAPFGAELVERWVEEVETAAGPRRRSWATGRAGRRRSTTSNGATARCSSWVRALPLRPLGCSSAPERRGSSVTHPSRFSSYHGKDGSPVRVPQRASQTVLQRGFLVFEPVPMTTSRDNGSGHRSEPDTDAVRQSPLRRRLSSWDARHSRACLAMVGATFARFGSRRENDAFVGAPAVHDLAPR